MRRKEFSLYYARYSRWWFSETAKDSGYKTCLSIKAKKDARNKLSQNWTPTPLSMKWTLEYTSARRFMNFKKIKINKIMDY